MLKPHLLQSVAEPSKRLFAAEKSLVISVASAGLTFLCFQNLLAFLVFGVVHGMMVSFTYRDPYFFEVLQCWLRTRKTRNLTPQEVNTYVA